jgi:FkbM family methyltransferase
VVEEGISTEPKENYIFAEFFLAALKFIEVTSVKDSALNNITKFIPKKIYLIYRNIKNNLFDGYATKSYSQEGEDLILKRMLGEKKSGFYVDVGAHHPKRFSNTYLFYQMGWRGINIEPNPGALALFKKYRPRDINLDCGVSDVQGQLLYYITNESALNSFCRELAEKRTSQKNYNIVDKKLINVYRLSTILAANIPNNTLIDFMSVDVEGYDINVLKSNDWSQFRPNLLLVEDLTFSFESGIHKFLTEQQYKIWAKTLNTVFYKDNLRKQG